MKKILCSVVLAAAAVAGINSAIASFNLQDFIAQAQSCWIHSDTDMEAEAKRLAGDQCESKSCSSYGYRYEFCGQFSQVTCYQCDGVEAAA